MVTCFSLNVKSYRRNPPPGWMACSMTKDANPKPSLPPASRVRRTVYVFVTFIRGLDLTLESDAYAEKYFRGVGVTP